MRKTLCTALILLAACGGNEPRHYQGYVEGDYLRIAAPSAGRVTALHVDRGAQVDAGARLFELESDREQAAVAEAGARLADLQKGRRPEELAVTRAQLSQVQAQLRLAQAQEKRQQEMRARGLSSTEAVDAVRTQRERDAARVRELEAAVQVGELAGRSDAIRAAQAQLQQAQWQLAQKTQAAPAAGLVENVYFRVGEWVPAGAPIVSLLPPENRKLRFFVPETIVGGLRIGAKLRASCDGCGAPLEAVVSFIASQAEFTPPVIYSRGQRERLVFLVEAQPQAGARARLQPGQPVDIELGP